ncbi:hypothetical protein WBJ53_31675 [Spirosoma sp. SC4-14]|uniref:hypothetical protein n=1 Tax=Spirosoma sp. SC4-14 TaxID=3128900 RepID=UPI0030D35021
MSKFCITTYPKDSCATQDIPRINPDGLEYYYYQHLVRDFKEFTPNAFYEAEAISSERVFGVAET